jgi:hypothetical protein
LVRRQDRPEASSPGRVERAWTLVRTGSIANCNLTKDLKSIDFSLVLDKNKQMMRKKYNSEDDTILLKQIAREIKESNSPAIKKSLARIVVQHSA